MKIDVSHRTVFGILILLMTFSSNIVSAKGAKPGKGGSSDPGNGTVSAFTVIGQIHVPRKFHSATKLADGRVLLAGGLEQTDFNTGESTINATAEVYDPATKTFSLVASMQIPRMYHSATLLPDGRLLVTGGVSDSNIYYGNTTEASAEIYDPTNNSWVLLPAMMIEPRYRHAATLLPDGRVLLTSNATPPPYSWYGYGDNSAELYDIATQSFIALPDMTTTGVLHISSVLTDGSAILIGGQRDNIWNNTSEIFDSVSHTFSPGEDMNFIHKGLSGVTLNSAGDVLITGQASSYNSDNSAEIFHAASGTFSVAGNMQQARQEHSSTISANHATVLIVGGHYEWLTNDGFLRTATAVNAETYDVATDTFTDIGPLNYERQSGHTATALDDGSFLIVGGSDTTNAELYVP